MKKEKFEFGAIYFVYDVSDYVYDRSYIGIAYNEDDFPSLDEDEFVYSDYGIYELTQEGLELLEKWKNDVSCGYDLCYGRCKGLADSIGSKDIDIFKHLIKYPDYSKQIN